MAATPLSLSRAPAAVAPRVAASRGSCTSRPSGTCRAQRPCRVRAAAGSEPPRGAPDADAEADPWRAVRDTGRHSLQRGCTHTHTLTR
jgi:hypothetical protein